MQRTSTVVSAPDPASLVLGDSRRSTCRFRGVVCHAYSRASRRLTVAPRAGVPPSPRWPRTLCLARWARTSSPIQTSVGHSPTGSNDRQRQPEAGIRAMGAAAGPGGGAALGWGAWVSPPPIFSPVIPKPAATTACGQHCEHALDTRRYARLPTLIATLPSPDREIVLLRVVAGCPSPTSWPSWVSALPQSAWLSIRPWAPTTSGDRQWAAVSHPGAGGLAITRPDRGH